MGYEYVIKCKSFAEFLDIVIIHSNTFKAVKDEGYVFITYNVQRKKKTKEMMKKKKTEKKNKQEYKKRIWKRKILPDELFIRILISFFS